MNVPTAPSLRLFGSHRWLQVPAAAVGVVVLAAGCGGGSSATKSTAQAPQASPSAGARGAGAGGGVRPGTTGKISAVNPTSIYVQDTSSQVTVNFSAKTTFTQSLTATASAIKVGDCVTATSAATGARPSAAPSASRTPATAITATAVTITSTTGTCTLGTGAGGQGRTPGAFPSGRARPSGAPSGGFGRGGGGFGGAAFGKVTAVGSGTFVVESTRNSKTTDVTVTTTAATTYRQEATATKANLKVGLCATAAGTTDDTGAVTARTIALSTAGANGCTQVGFGGGRFRPAGAGSSGGAG